MRFRSIFLRIAFRTIAIQIFFSILILTLFTSLYAKWSITRLHQELRASTESAAAIIRSNYTSGDLLNLRRSLADLVKTNEWISAKFIDSEGSVVWSAERPARPPNNLVYLFVRYISSSDIRVSEFAIYQTYTQNILFSDAGATLGTLVVESDFSSKLNQFTSFCVFVILASIILIVSFAMVSFISLKTALAPVTRLKSELSVEAKKIGLSLADQDVSDEVGIIPIWFKQVALAWQVEKNRAIERTNAMAFGRIAKQIAHDIRSPLSALNVAMNENDCNLPDRRRLIVRAVERINSIANGLLLDSKKMIQNHVDRSESIALLSSVVEVILAEKQLEYRAEKNVEITFKREQDSFGLFTSFDATTLKRVLSNLINNAVEAYSEESRRRIVEVTLRSGERNLKMLWMTGQEATTS